MEPLITASWDEVERTWITTAHLNDARQRFWRIEVKWSTEPMRGRYEPASVAISRDGAAITAEGVRQLPLGTLIVDMRGEIADKIRRVATGPWIEGQAVWEGQMPDDHPEERRALLEEAAVFGVQRGRRLSGDLLEIVAATYREAYRTGQPVTQAVADRTGCSNSTAAKRIMAARKAGLLEGVEVKR